MIAMNCSHVVIGTVDGDNHVAYREPGLACLPVAPARSTCTGVSDLGRAVRSHQH